MVTDRKQAEIYIACLLLTACKQNVINNIKYHFILPTIPYRQLSLSQIHTPGNSMSQMAHQKML